MTRVSTINTFNDAYNNISDNYIQVAKISNTIGSRNKFQSFGALHNGGDVKFLADLAKTNEEADAYMQNVNVARIKLEAAKSIVEEVIEIAEYAKNQMWMYQSHGFFSAEQIQKMAEFSLYNLKSSLNSTLTGNYMLSGGKSDEPPVTTIMDPSLQELSYKYYDGDEFIPTIKLRSDVDVQCSVGANNKAFAELISALNILYYHSSDYDSIERARSILDTSITDLINLRYELMSNYSLLNKYENYWQNIRDHSDNNYIHLEDEYHFSLPELLADLSTSEVVLEASNSIFSTISSMHLIG